MRANVAANNATMLAIVNRRKP